MPSQKEKSSSNHPFPAAMLVSGRVNSEEIHLWVILQILLMLASKDLSNLFWIQDQIAGNQTTQTYQNMQTSKSLSPPYWMKTKKQETPVPP